MTYGDDNHQRRAGTARPPVLVADTWATNAALISDCARLGYLRATDHVLDPTWGRGRWWLQWQPQALTRHDLYTLDGVDFRNLPEGDGVFDAAAFDPPYVSVGGRDTSGLPDMLNRYGMDRAPKSPLALHEMNSDGLEEIARVVKPGGLILAKCANYISSGKFQPAAHWLWCHATRGLHLEQVDEFHHIRHPRPQPPRARQVHARSNSSVLFVFRKGK